MEVTALPDAEFGTAQPEITFFESGHETTQKRHDFLNLTAAQPDRVGPVAPGGRIETDRVGHVGRNHAGNRGAVQNKMAHGRGKFPPGQFGGIPVRGRKRHVEAVGQ